MTLRAKRLYWLLNARSPNYRRLRKDDSVIFYIGGKKGGFFQGACALSSEPQRLPADVKRYIIEDPEDRFNYYVNLKEVKVFSSPKPVAQLLNSLSFVKNRAGWWRHFQGSIIQIPEEDYYAILNHKA